MLDRERRAPDSLRCVTSAACVPAGREGVLCVSVLGMGIWIVLFGWEVAEGAIVVCGLRRWADRLLVPLDR